jgi:hypothetical protein
MTKQSNPRYREDIPQRDLDDGCVLQVPEQPQVFTLNITAALVWELSEGGIQHLTELIERCPCFLFMSGDIYKSVKVLNTIQ